MFSEDLFQADSRSAHKRIRPRQPRRAPLTVSPARQRQAEAAKAAEATLNDPDRSLAHLTTPTEGATRLKQMQMEIDNPVYRQMMSRSSWVKDLLQLGTPERVWNMLLADFDPDDPQCRQALAWWAESFNIIKNNGISWPLAQSITPESTPIPNLLTGWQKIAFDYALELKVDPVLMIMLIQNEINNKNALDHGDFGLLWRMGSRSFGLGEVRTDTAVRILDKYPEVFARFEGIYPDDIRKDGQYNEYAVGWILYTYEEFNIAIVATYIKDNELWLIEDVTSYGITISEKPVHGATIPPEEFRDLLIISYNTGWGVYSDRLKDKAGPFDVLESLIRTIDANKDHLDNVMGLKNEIEELVGFELAHDYEGAPDD